ncbi:hypothetical protein AOLI_G00188510 [Acnodon oligacanthus]
MERVGFFCLLLCGSVHMISSEQYHTGTKAPETATSTTHRSSRGATQGAFKPAKDGLKNGNYVLRIVLITVAVGCLFGVVLILYLLRYFYKMKVNAVKPNQEHFYDSIDDFVPVTQLASDQINTYYLSTFPGVQITDNPEYETTYPLKENSTPKEQDEQPYARVIKPKE